MKRFAQSPGREQAIVRVLRRDQHNVKITRQRAMLKGIVEQMKLWAKPGLGKASGSIARLADDHWHFQFAGDQQRFVPKLLRQAARVDEQDSFRVASITAGEHVELDVAGLQQLTEQNNERRLARSARG